MPRGGPRPGAGRPRGSRNRPIENGIEGCSTLAMTVPEAARAVSIGPTLLRSAINNGALVARRIGGRTVILADELSAWMHSLPPVRAQHDQVQRP